MVPRRFDHEVDWPNRAVFNVKLLIHGLWAEKLRYKTAEGKKENKFGFGGKPQGAAFARKIVATGRHWCELSVLRTRPTRAGGS